MGPWPSILEKPLESLHSTVTGFHVDLLTKAFIPIDDDQREFH